MSYSLSPGGGRANGCPLQCRGGQDWNLHRHRRHAEAAESEGGGQHPVLPLPHQAAEATPGADRGPVRPHTRHSG